MTLTHQAWLIDLDGTLYRPPLIKLLMGVELLVTGPHRTGVLRAFRHAHEELRHAQAQDPQLSFSPSPYAEQVRRTAQQLNCEPQKVQQIAQRWMIEKPTKWLGLAIRHSLLDEIRQFRAQGGKTALVSDYPAQLKLQALRASQLFDVVVANGESEELRRLKPAPDSYLLAAQKLDLSPQQCLVIGDRDDADGAAARAAGMQFRHIR